MTQFWDVYGANADLPCVMDLIPGNFHADILVGTSTVDVSSYINQALADYRMVRLPLRGQLSVGSPLMVPAGGGIFGYNYQCTIKALPNFGDYPVIRNAFGAATSNASRARNFTFAGFRIDGNRANNSTATQFSHGVKLHAVDNCAVDLEVADVKGDGLLISYADYPHSQIGCSNVYGRMRTYRCGRHGVAVVCGEQINLDIIDDSTDFMSLDLEPDEPVNIIRNCMFRVLSRRTGNGTDVSGGVCVAGDSLGCLPTNVTVDFEVHETGGYGVLWRDAINLTLRGSVHGSRAALVGLAGGVGPSTVYFDGVRVINSEGGGFVARETVGSIYDGSVYVMSSGQIGAQIENARGGVLQLRVENSRQEGVYLRNSSNMTFPNLITQNNQNNNLRLLGGSIGNRFPGLKSVNSSNGWGFFEEAGCNDNKAMQARIAGNGGGAISIAGSASYVMPEA